MLPKNYVRSLGLGRVIVPLGVALHAKIDEKSIHQRIFGLGCDATPLGLEISSRTIAPIATHEQVIEIIGIKPIAPYTLIFPDKLHDAILVTSVAAGIHDIVLPAKQAEKGCRISEGRSGLAFCTAPEIADPRVQTHNTVRNGKISLDRLASIATLLPTPVGDEVTRLINSL